MGSNRGWRRHALHGPGPRGDRLLRRLGAVPCRDDARGGPAPDVQRVKRRDQRPGVGSTALLFNASVFLVGVFSILGAYFLHRVHKRKLLTIAFLLAGVGALGVGLFPETIPLPHSISALTAFLFGGIAAILAYPLEKEPLNYISVILGVLGLASLVLFVSGTYLGIGFGGMERMIVYPVLLWEVALGGYLLAAPTEPLPPPKAVTDASSP